MTSTFISKRMTGDGGLHLFIELEEHMNARTLLQKCYEKGVTFSPGDVFTLMEKERTLSD